jgi:hypothetical protein
MRKIILSLVLLPFLAFAQAPAIDWQKALGGTASDVAYCIKQTTDGGYIVAGYTQSNNGDVTGNHGGEDIWVIKLSATGTIEWQKTLGGTQYDEASSIQQTTDGGYIIAGLTGSNNGDVTGYHGSNDYWIVKLFATGTIQWQKTIGGTSIDFAQSIQQTTDGGYIVAGYTYSNNGDVTGNHSDADYWVVKLSPTGTIQWQKTLGGTGREQANSIQQTTDGGYIVAGYTNSNNGDVTGNHGGYDYWVVKLSSTGTIEWQKTLGGTGDDQAFSIQQTLDGSYIVAGYAGSNNGDVTGNLGGFDYWVVKLSTTGTIQWQKILGGTQNDEAFSIQQTTDAGFIVAGYTYSNDGDVIGFHPNQIASRDIWIVKLNPTGTIQWQKILGGTVDDIAYSIIQTTDGGYIVAGYTTSNDYDVSGNHGGTGDYWVVKLGPDALSTIVFSKSELKVFPNPTTNTLTLQNSNSFTIDKIIITDLTGKIIKEQTQNTSSINVENLTQGTYILEGFSGEYKYTTKFEKK